MSWREAFRLSGVAFSELAFQAIYASRQGNLAPQGPARLLARQARRRVNQSKAIVSGLLGLLALGAGFALRAASVPGRVPAFAASPAVFDAGVLTALLSLDVGFLWWTGMQVLPTFLAAGVLPVLETLPVDDRTLDRTAGLLYLRLFDLPAATVLVATPLAVGSALGPLAGALAAIGAGTTIALSLALSLLTGRFFVRRVQGARGGGGSLLRWAYLAAWLVPAFAIFAFVTVAPAFFGFLDRATTGGPSLPYDLLLGAFPYPFGALAAAAAHGAPTVGLGGSEVVLAGAAAAGYLGLALAAVAWTFSSVRHIPEMPGRVAGPVRPGLGSLRPVRPALSVLTKDLRIASRTPGYAFLILLPMLDAAALGLWTLASAPGPSAALGLGLGAVTSAALLATFFGPAFFAVEVLAYSYGRTLPLPHRSLVVGKVALVGGIYLAASGIVLGLTLARIFDPGLFAAFVLAELPGVLAASFLELGILFRRARTRGLPITNLYAGAWFAILVAIPGVVVATLPLVAFQEGRLVGDGAALVLMAGVALAELALSIPVAFGRRAA